MGKILIFQDSAQAALNCFVNNMYYKYSTTMCIQSEVPAVHQLYSMLDSAEATTCMATEYSIGPLISTLQMLESLSAFTMYPTYSPQNILHIIAFQSHQGDWFSKNVSSLDTHFERS